MDLIRYRYRAQMRARFGDDESIFEVDWQWVNNEDVPGIPYPIAFGSNHTDPVHVDMDQVGEVRQTFYPAAKTYLPEFLEGEHYCGTQDQWQNGWPEGTTGSPIVDGVPVCCVADMGAPFSTGFSFGFES